jgi:hypothetical protein
LTLIECHDLVEALATKRADHAFRNTRSAMASRVL